MIIKFISALTLCMATGSCIAHNEKGSTADNATIGQTAVFNADSAYNYIKSQLGFGPRIPGTQGHNDCATYLVGELNKYGADTVIWQTTKLTAFNGDILPIINIMGRYNIHLEKRILLVAHWDTRPWADQEPDISKHTQPILGANDGASGVGVLLEIARNINSNPPQIGIDILFVDAEDYGTTNNEGSWCLGSQYWIKNMPYKSGELPIFGILLDMVGGYDAKFHREYISNSLAKSIVDKVWAMAAVAGYHDIFLDKTGGSVLDDHFFINIGGIPCIDIIENFNPISQSFNPTWHTLADNIDNIDRNSLKAVGQTVLNTIYQEQAK